MAIGIFIPYVGHREGFEQEFCDLVDEFSKRVNEAVIVYSDYDLSACQATYVDTASSIEKLFSAQKEPPAAYKNFPFFRYWDADPRFREKGRFLPQCATLLHYFEAEMQKHHFSAFFCWARGNAIRKLSFCMLDLVCQNHKIPAYFIMRTPSKGRIHVYDSIFYQSKDVEESVQYFLKAGLTEAEEQRYQTYIRRYVDAKKEGYTENIRLKKMRGWKAKYMSFKYKDCLLLDKAELKGEPYILFLPNKSDNWFASYALENWTDMEYLTRCLWQAIPKGYHLVVKDHPHVPLGDPSRLKILENAKSLPNFHYLGNQIRTGDFVKDAAFIATTSSTSGFEALYSHKSSLIMGNRPLYYSDSCTGIRRVEKIDNLHDKVNELLSQPEQTNRGRELIYATLTTSIPICEKEGDFSFYSDFDETSPRRVADAMAAKFKKYQKEKDNPLNREVHL